jgi:hypothetical protein
VNKKIFLPALVLLLRAGAVFSQDYGLTLRALPVLTNGDKPYGNAEFTATATPWFAAPLGEAGDLYLSGGISAEYSASGNSDETWKPVPEVYRFEISYRFDSGLRLEAGRLLYREPLNLFMNGLFDGFALGLDLGKTRLSAGAFYTGLLYKKTANITISPGDYTDYYDRDAYFASRRLAFALGWEIPALFHTGGKLDLGITGQVDLNEPDDQTNGDVKIHSQYVLAECTLPFLNYFNAELGTLLGIIEEEGVSPGLCFAVSGGLAWLPPGGVNDRLSLNTAFSSGAWNDRMRAFVPINTIAQGKVLRPGISGIALTELQYIARFHTSFSAEISTAYFFRTDSLSYRDPDLDSTSLSPLLGGEVSGGLVWAPVSDISFTLNGGAFFPQWGKAFAADTPVKWRVSLETILSF